MHGTRPWRWGACSWMAILCAAFVGLGLGGRPAVAQERLILKKESVYNTIFVFEQSGYRYLKFGHNARHYVESIYNPKDVTEMPSTYTRYMTVGIAYAQTLDAGVVVGMGGGRTTWYMAHYLPEMQVTGVELDKEIIRIADEHFDVRPGGNLSIAERDGRIFFRQRPDDRFDIIQVDAYRGPFVPFHLLTKEYYELLESRLKPGGVVVQNIEPTTMLFDHAIATIGSVFDQVDLYLARGNIVAVAYDGERVSSGDLRERASNRQAQYGFRYDLATLVDGRVAQTPEADPEKVLTDDFAPANYLRSVKRHNRRWDEQLADSETPHPLDSLLKQ